MARFEHFDTRRSKVTWTDAAAEAMREGAIFFDFIPDRPAIFEGRPVRIHLATSPDPARPRALAFSVDRANAVLFVADSARARLGANVAALEVVEDLVDRADVPFVFLFNKRDVDGAVPVDELREALRVLKAPCFEGVIPEGTGTPALKGALAAAFERHKSIVAAWKRR